MAKPENYFFDFCDARHWPMLTRKFVPFLADFIGFFPQTSKSAE
jgi:hypothetical protein